MGVSNPAARAFYEIEAARESWSVRELERQIGSLLFDRLARNRDKDEVLALARQGQLLATPGDVLKDPMVLEFLDLQERTEWHERDLEQAIIHRLGNFLLELGKGFCFIGRQKRITLNGDHFYVDLVLYNRILRSFHQDRESRGPRVLRERRCPATRRGSFGNTLGFLAVDKARL